MVKLYLKRQVSGECELVKKLLKLKVWSHRGIACIPGKENYWALFLRSSVS